jgi:hypothetical protein
MKQMAKATLVAIFALLIGGCAANKEISDQIHQKSMERGNIFKEVADASSLQGFSVLVIRATLKTVKEGFYPLESGRSQQGKAEYPFVFNIGGQGVIWMAKGLPDTQKRIVDGKRNPEGGDGVKYTLEKRITLRAGRYKIYIGLTEANIQEEIAVTLTAGKTSILDFRPLYFPGRHNRNTGSFYQGLRDFEVYLDGKTINQKRPSDS